MLGWDLSLKAGIWAIGLNIGLEAGIWALRLEFGPRDYDLGLKAGIWGGHIEEEKGQEEKFPLCMKAWVIGPFVTAA